MIKKKILASAVSGFFVFAAFSGCTTTKTIEVPVPVPCRAPQNLPLPHDYMKAIGARSSASEFVKACLMTRQSYKNAYNACSITHKGE